MVKTTIKDAKSVARFTDLKSVKDYLKNDKLKVLSVEKIAYTTGVYGCSGYLLRIEAKSTLPHILGTEVLTAFTGRSTWMYNCTSLSFYNEA